MMFPSYLRTFYEVVRRGSIRKAGEALDLAPSSISRQIMILERQLGVPLFERTTKGLSLTPAGKLVTDYARSALIDYSSLRSDVDALQNLQGGFVRIASVEGGVSEGVMKAVASMCTRFKGVRLQLNILTASQVVDAVRLGDADVGITFDSKPLPQLQYHNRASDPIVSVVSPSHEFAARKITTIEELRQFPLAVPEPTFKTRQILDDVAHSKGFSLTPTLSSDSLLSLRRFAKSGVGIAILPRLETREDEMQGLLKIVPIDDGPLKSTTIDIIVLKKRRLSRVLTAFLSDIRSSFHRPSR